MTEWRDISGWFGFYQVSNAGDVRALARVVRRKNGTTQAFPRRSLRAMVNSKGYLAVRLSAPNKRMVVPVHKLVAVEFVENPKQLPQVNHLDGMKGNNSAANLEWTDSRGNLQHAWRMGLRKSVPFLPAPPSAAGVLVRPPDRLRELARAQARMNHDGIWDSAHWTWKVAPHIERDFATCPHPDCVLVRPVVEPK